MQSSLSPTASDSEKNETPRSNSDPHRVQLSPPSKALRNHVLSFLICAVLGCLLHAACFRFTPVRLLLGYSGDNYQHAWFLWHFARSVTHGENPFYTQLQFFILTA